MLGQSRDYGSYAWLFLNFTSFMYWCTCIGVHHDCPVQWCSCRFTVMRQWNRHCLPFWNTVLDPSGYFDPGTENIYTVLPVDVTYTSLQRPDRSDTSVHYFPEPFVLEFLFDVPSMFSCIYTKVNTALMRF
jgi:hypothetical protein